MKNLSRLWKLPMIMALRGTVKKWEAIVEGSGEDQGSVNCPLCWKYQSKDCNSKDCNNCPVKNKTGLKNCAGSPYIDWHNHHMDEHFRRRSKVVKCVKCERLAKKELDFLMDILKEERA